MDENDLDAVSDFLIRKGAKLNVTNTPFHKKLNQDPNFKKACTRSSADPLELTEAVARGLVIYMPTLHPFWRYRTTSLLNRQHIFQNLSASAFNHPINVSKR